MTTPDAVPTEETSLAWRHSSHASRRLAESCQPASKQANALRCCLDTRCRHCREAFSRLKIDGRMRWTASNTLLRYVTLRCDNERYAAFDQTALSVSSIRFLQLHVTTTGLSRAQCCTYNSDPLRALTSPFRTVQLRSAWRRQPRRLTTWLQSAAARGSLTRRPEMLATRTRMLWNCSSVKFLETWKRMTWDQCLKSLVRFTNWWCSKIEWPVFTKVGCILSFSLMSVISHNPSTCARCRLSVLLMLTQCEDTDAD